MYTKLLAACVLTTYAMLCFGCQKNVVYTRTQWLAPVSPNSLVQEASQIIRTALADTDPAIRVNAIEVVAISKRIRLIPKPSARFATTDSVPS